MIFAEVVGPWTVGLAALMIVGLPFMAHYVKRSLNIDLGPLKAQLGDVKATADTIEHAVNGVSPGEPRMIDQVRALRASVAALHGEVGDLKVQQQVTTGAVTHLDERVTKHIADGVRQREHDEKARRGVVDRRTQED